MSDTIETTRARTNPLGGVRLITLSLAVTISILLCAAPLRSAYAQDELPESLAVATEAAPVTEDVIDSESDEQEGQATESSDANPSESINDEIDETIEEPVDTPSENEEPSTAAYTVLHYVRTAEGSYELVQSDNLVAAPDAEVSAVALSMDGYTFVSGTTSDGLHTSNSSALVATDGSTVLCLYYEPVAFEADQSQDDDNPTADTQQGSETSESGPAYTPESDVADCDLATTPEATKVVRTLAAPAKAPVLAAAAANGGAFGGTASDVYWNVENGTLTLSVAGDGNNITIGPEYQSFSLPWKNDWGKDQINRVVIDGRIKVSSFAGWFQDYKQLVSFTVNGTFDASSVTSFASMFAGCTNLTDVSSMANWATSSTANYDRTFQECRSLATLDLSGWSIPAGAGSNMLMGLESITQLILPGSVVLTSTGLGSVASDRTATRGATSGTWVRTSDGVTFSTAELVSSYSASSTVSGKQSYTFKLEAYFASNRNVRWSFDNDTKALTIYVDNASNGADTSVKEAYNTLPWLPSVDVTTILSVTVKDTDKATGAAAKVVPSNIASWFKGYSLLSSFDGSGLDVSKINSFAELFSGDLWLANVNLSGWDMSSVTSAGSLTQMFYGCTNLTSLTLPRSVRLQGSGIANTLSGRGALAGSWDATITGADTIVWFGTTDNLVTRYPITGSSLTDSYTYVWHANQKAGRFSNDSAWWTFDSSTGKLTLGLDDGATNIYVSETAAQQPWLQDAQGTKIINKNDIRSVVTTGGIAPVTLENWFNGYAALTSFDGSGMSVNSTTSFAGLFKSLAALATIDLSGWVMSPSAPRDGMFADASGIARLTLDKDVILTDTGLNSELVLRTPLNGSWQTEDRTTWFGSSNDLAARYPASASDSNKTNTTYIYVWNGNLKSGRFSNDNAWWQYSDDGTLTIGVSNPDKDCVVSEVSNSVFEAQGKTGALLPWRTISSISLTNIYIRSSLSAKPARACSL